MDVLDDKATELGQFGRRRQVRTRQLVMVMFLGATVMAAGQFIGPMIAILYFREYGSLFQGALLFLGFTIVSFSLIQFYLEFGTIRLRDFNIGPVRLSGSSNVEHPVGAVGEIPHKVLTPDLPSRLDSPSIDSPAALASRLAERLENEIGLQSRRANTNLTLGILAALVGLLFLGWLSFLTATQLTSSVDKAASISAMLYWGSFASKISLSLAANVFALFFFTSYRRNLSEIRYFHNELTNVQARLVAIGLTATGAADLRKIAIKSLVDIERNFILRKGETTTEVALREHDRQDLAILVSLLTEGSRLAPLQPDRPRARPAVRRGKA